MKKFIIIYCLFALLNVQAQQYEFVADSLQLISMQELFQKGAPSHMDNVFYDDGTPASFQDVMPQLKQGKLMPHMFVDGNGEFHTLVVYEPVNLTFESMEPNTQYGFLPDNLRLLPEAQLFKNPPPQALNLVYFEDGTAITIQEARMLMQKGKGYPKMYVNEELKYVALIVVKK